MNKYAQDIVLFATGQKHKIFVDIQDILEMSVIIKLLHLDCKLCREGNNFYYMRNIDDIKQFLKTGDSSSLKQTSIDILCKYMMEVESWDTQK